MKVLAAAVLSLALLDPVCAQFGESNSAQGSAPKPPEVAQTLSIARRGSQPSRQGPAENFTGSPARRSAVSAGRTRTHVGFLRQP